MVKGVSIAKRVRLLQRETRVSSSLEVVPGRRSMFLLARLLGMVDRASLITLPKGIVSDRRTELSGAQHGF